MTLDLSRLTICLLATGDAGAPSGLSLVDWAIIALYAAGTIGLGWYYGRRQRSTQEYFVGNRRMNPLLIGVSLFATLLSTISYFSGPGEMVGKGPVSSIAYLLAVPISYLIIGYLLIPRIMRRRVTSAYELLEERLGVLIRVLGGTLFIVLRLMWMSLLLYVAASAMSVMMGVGESWIPLIVLVTACVAVTYTSLGGLRAVVITDLIQTILLWGGALLVIAVVTVKLGGFEWWFQALDDTVDMLTYGAAESQPQWDHQPLFSFDPKTRLTVIGRIISMVVWIVCTHGSDQTVIQRYMATGGATAARRSVLAQFTVAIIITVTLWHVGLALMGYFQAHPHELPADVTFNQADKIFPHFISFHLPMGISGLVVAAMFAAAMSSIDSGVNSITAVISVDFLDRFKKQPRTEKGQLLLAKLIAIAIGAVVVLVGSVYMQHVSGNITAVTSKISELLVAPLFCLFFFALFVPFAKPAGVLAGSICGVATAILIAFSGPIFGMDRSTGEELDPISFMWIGPTALVVNILVGVLVSLAMRKR